MPQRRNLVGPLLAPGDDLGTREQRGAGYCSDGAGPATEMGRQRQTSRATDGRDERQAAAVAFRWSRVRHEHEPTVTAPT
jgi:hypothetical protein